MKPSFSFWDSERCFIIVSVKRFSKYKILMRQIEQSLAV